jgi:HD-GYP domain-containing protein (c-di-GMP phosphodiesterase class II)
LRIVPLDEQVVGERLGQPIFGPDGRLLLHAGIRLDAKYRDMLRARGYDSVPVQDPLAPDVMAAGILREATEVTARAALDRCLQNVGEPSRGAVNAVRQVVERIIADIASNASLAYNICALRSVQDTLFTHSVNVCVYAVVLGSCLAMEREDLRKLGVGALLHDIGKIYHLDLVNKPGRLTPDEFERIKRHTTDGYELLRRQDGIDLLSAHVAFQHHERLDGTGYPRGIGRDRIHPWALITAVADVFDTITGDRPYGVGLPSCAAMAELRRAAESGQLEPGLVRHLSHRVAAYPDGSILLLESGQVAVVVAQTADGAEHPLIRVLTDPHLQLIEPREVVLSGVSPEASVRSVLADYPRKVRAQFAFAVRT